MKGLELPDEVLRAASAGLLPKRLESEERIFFPWKIVMPIASCCIIRLKRTVMLLIPSYYYQRIKIKSRAFLTIDIIVSVCIECRRKAVRMFAICSQRKNIRCHIENQTGR